MEVNLENLKFKKHECDSEFMKMEVGGELIGVYLGSEPSNKYPNTRNFKFDFGKDIGIKFLSGVIITKHIEDEKNPIKEGTVVKVIYHGKPSGKNYDDYEVYVAETDK